MSGFRCGAIAAAYDTLGTNVSWGTEQCAAVECGRMLDALRALPDNEQTRRKSIGNADYERSAWRVLITIGLLTKFDFVSSFSHFEKIKMV